MAHLEVDDVTGQAYWIDDEGNEHPADEPGLLGQAGRQFADLGSGAQYAYGNLTDNPQLMAQAQADTQARNEMFYGADQAYPYQSMAGQALPGLATAPMGGFFTNIGLGAAEGALDMGQGGTMAERGAVGAGGALAGDILSRVFGRAFNLAEGISQAVAGRGLKANPQAEAFERLGGETLAYQRMTPDTLGQQFAERATQGAQASLWGAPQVKAAANANYALFNRTAAEATGMPLGKSGVLDGDWRSAALDMFNDQYRKVEEVARGTGDIVLPDDVANRLARNSDIKDAGASYGMFEGILSGDRRLSAGEYLEARDSLGDTIQSLYNRGKNKAAKRAEVLLDELDDSIAEKVPAGFKEDFARLREQYRVFMQLEKPNIISKEGNINTAALNRQLRNPNTGFGRTATAGGETTNAETARLIDLAEAGDKPQFGAFKSSGTAENQALREGVDDIAQVAQGGSLLGPVLNQGAPLVTPFMEMGGGLPYEYLINRAAPSGGVMIGQGLGRSLDEQFYPFVGIDDERGRP